MTYWGLKALLTPVLRFFYRVRVEGLEHVPTSGAAILASNHISFSDSIFTPLVVKRKVTFVAKAEYFTGKGIKGTLMRMFFVGAGTIPVDRSGGKVFGVSGDAVSFAVRSSATAEDLPDASFAGQQETFLNVRGIDAVLAAIKEVFASLYNDRAIAYRVHHKFAHEAVALSAGVQRMVRSDIGASGVMFTMDTESGFSDAVFLTSSYGLGEAVVQGAVNPDEFYIYKPALRAGRPAILKRGVGDKALKMVYTGESQVGRTAQFTEVDAADRRARRGSRTRGVCVLRRR